MPGLRITAVGQSTIDPEDKTKFVDLTDQIKRVIRQQDFANGVVFVTAVSKNSFVFTQEAYKGVELDFLSLPKERYSSNNLPNPFSRPLALIVENSQVNLGTYQQIIGVGTEDIGELQLHYFPLLARKDIVIDTGNKAGPNNFIYEHKDGDYLTKGGERIFGITADVGAFVQGLPINGEAYVLISSPHTTLGIAKQTPKQAKSLLEHLAEKVPRNPFYHHNQHHRMFTISEPPNAESHLKQIFVGSWEAVKLFENGQLYLKDGEEIMMCELDGPRAFRNVNFAVYLSENFGSLNL